VLAPVLLVVLRSAQGLSVGGEAAGATAFVVEHAPEGRRGWYGSWLWSTLALGVAGGIGAAVLLIRRGGPAALTVGYVLVALPLSCLVIVPSYLAELFPTRVRSSALAVAAVAAASTETAFRPLDAAHQPEPEPARPRR
jgi:MFS family permease